MEKKINIKETKKEAEKILAKINDLARGRDYAKLVKEGKIDQKQTTKCKDNISKVQLFLCFFNIIICNKCYNFVDLYLYLL